MTTTRRVARPAPGGAIVHPVRLFAARAGGGFDADVGKLLRFVLLSMALHALVVLIFGTATGGIGGRRGDTPAGPLEVTLRALGAGVGSGVRPVPGADVGPDSQGAGAATGRRDAAAAGAVRARAGRRAPRAGGAGPGRRSRRRLLPSSAPRCP